MFCKVLPKLDANVVIVLENVPYHSTKVEKFPRTTWNKDQQVEWLTEKGVTVERTITDGVTRKT